LGNFIALHGNRAEFCAKVNSLRRGIGYFCIWAGLGCANVSVLLGQAGRFGGEMW
jgi:hypothetical protein